MRKYSFTIKNSNEVIKSTYAVGLNEAIEIFAKIKVLSRDKFLKLYEVRQE